MMNAPLPLKKVVVAWSGGIDSTAVLACLLRRGYDCLAVTSDLYFERAPKYFERERRARQNMMPVMLALAKEFGGSLSLRMLPSEALWAFSADGVEIARRNKLWVDLIMARIVIPDGFMNLALGEYVGVDSWLVRDHVPGFDCDHRALSAYLLSEYGIRYRLISLQDFGESRYKSDRLRIGVDAMGVAMGMTTNCMRNQLTDCGTCYKCIERHAAFKTLGIEDLTHYDEDPAQQPNFDLYLAQMRGEAVQQSVSAFKAL